VQACDSHRKGQAMNAPSYLDFDFDVARHGTRYRGRVLSSPAGQAAHEFALPFEPLELENFYLRVGRARRRTRRIGSPEMSAARAYGRRLFDASFGGEVDACLRAALSEAQRQEKGLRIRLRLTEAPELGDLAWEYLCNPALERFLSLSVETPIVRYFDLPEAIRPLKLTKPLRVLVVASTPSDHPALDVEREWLKLKEALGDLEGRGWIKLERLRDGRLTSLQKRIRTEEWHVFHFIGHGGFDPQTQDGTLIFEDAAGKGHAVSGEYLGALLHDERTLRLAMLNACEGARTSLSDPFSGVAQSLVRQGVPAVIAMQFEITDDAAITIAHEFYGAIADGYPVDAALAEARKALFAQGNDIEWGTPVLYMRSPDGRIFEIDQAEAEGGPVQGAAADPQPEPPVEPPGQAPRQTQTPPQTPPEPRPPEPQPSEPQPQAVPPAIAAGALDSGQRLPRLLWPGVLAAVAAAVVLSLWRGPAPQDPGTRELESTPKSESTPTPTPESSSKSESTPTPTPESKSESESKSDSAPPSGTSPPATGIPIATLRDRISQGDSEALLALQRLARSGDADAQYTLGRMMTVGDGMPKNAAEGRSWMQKAAAQGHAEAIRATAPRRTEPVKATARLAPATKPSVDCSDLLEKQSLGLALSAEERAGMDKECR
jgi:hypothetical protein